MDWPMLSAIGSIIAAAVAALSVIGALWRWNAKIMDHLNVQDVHLAQQDVKIDAIKHEVFANSGKSMRDKIEQAAKDISELKGYVQGKGES